VLLKAKVLNPTALILNPLTPLLLSLDAWILALPLFLASHSFLPHDYCVTFLAWTLSSATILYWHWTTLLCDITPSKWLRIIFSDDSQNQKCVI
jgi:hypothetical protein